MTDDWGDGLDDEDSEYWEKEFAGPRDSDELEDDGADSQFHEEFGNSVHLVPKEDDEFEDLDPSPVESSEEDLSQQSYDDFVDGETAILNEENELERNWSNQMEETPNPASDVEPTLGNLMSEARQMKALAIKLIEKAARIELRVEQLIAAELKKKSGFEDMDDDTPF